MKRKCEHCQGKGGWHKNVGRVFVTIFVSCQHCLGKGTWWTNKKPKPPKK